MQRTCCIAPQLSMHPRQQSRTRALAGKEQAGAKAGVIVQQNHSESAPPASPAGVIPRALGFLREPRGTRGSGWMGCPCPYELASSELTGKLFSKSTQDLLAGDNVVSASLFFSICDTSTAAVTHQEAREAFGGEIFGWLVRKAFRVCVGVFALLWVYLANVGDFFFPL